MSSLVYRPIWEKVWLGIEVWVENSFLSDFFSVGPVSASIWWLLRASVRHPDALCSLKLLGSSRYPCLGEASCHLLYWEPRCLSNNWLLLCPRCCCWSFAVGRAYNPAGGKDKKWENSSIISDSDKYNEEYNTEKRCRRRSVGQCVLRRGPGRLSVKRWCWRWGVEGEEEAPRGAVPGRGTS